MFWLSWLRFRRDLGRPLPNRCRRRVQTLAASGCAWCRRTARGLLTPDDAVSAAMAVQRQQFMDWLARQRAQGGVCVVGNAAGLAGRQLGARIDGHAAVVRFNRWWGGDPIHTFDLGQRLDVWVCAPDPPVAPPSRPAWVVVSGADPVASLPRWPVLQSLAAQGVPVLTVPLPVWRAQVARLGAPPSAGVLLLAWLAGQGWPGVTVAGIGWGATPQGRHHLVLSRRQTGRRHRWDAEAQQVAAWRRQGLSDLGMPTPAAADPGAGDTHPGHGAVDERDRD